MFLLEMCQIILNWKREESFQDGKYSFVQGYFQKKVKMICLQYHNYYVPWKPNTKIKTASKSYSN